MTAKQLRLGDQLRLPLDAVTRTTAIVGQRGTGKTSTAVVMAEEALHAGAQAAVIDPTGAWYGLRTSADGNGPGLEVVVFGGHHGDVPLEHQAGAFLARLIIDEGISVVLDLELMTKAKQVQFVAELAEELYHRNRRALTLIVDEAHRFTPQQLRDPGGYGARCLGAVTDVVTLGRRKGLGAVLISQRPAKINKDVFEQAEIMIAHRLMGPNDRKAIAGWLDEAAGADTVDVTPATLPSLEQGQALVWAPSYDVYGRYAIRAKRTFDSSATPEIGATVIEPKGRADMDLAAIETAMAETIERAKADDPVSLRKTIGQLRRQVAELEQRPTEAERIEIPVEVIREVPMLKHGNRLETVLLPVLERMPDLLGEAAAEIRVLRERVDTMAAAPESSAPPRREPPRPRAASSPARPAPAPARQTDHGGAERNGDEPQLKAGARKILETLARHHPMRFTRAQVGTLTGFKITGGTFNTYWGVLKRAGYIDETGGETVVTDHGLDRAGVVPEQPASTEEMVAMWGARLKRGARDMLNLLVDQYPGGLTRDELAEQLDMAVTGGTFNTYLGTLRRNGLADVDDHLVVASDTLFIGAPA